MGFFSSSGILNQRGFFSPPTTAEASPPPPPPSGIPVALTLEILVSGLTQQNSDPYLNIGFSIADNTIDRVGSGPNYSQESFDAGFDNRGQFNLTHSGSTWTFTFDTFFDGSPTATYTWTASGPSSHVPETGWTGGANNATGELVLAAA